MKKIALLSFLLMTASNHALAQENKYTGGMKYTTMRAAQPSDSQKPTLYNRKPAPAETEPAKDTSKQPEARKDALPVLEEPPQKSAPESAWDKYKELAEGKKEDESETTVPQKPSKPETPNKEAKAEQVQNTGFGAIIEGYRQNKQKRGQMKSIRFAKPEIEKPSAQKPEVEKPQVDKPKAETPQSRTSKND